MARTTGVDPEGSGINEQRVNSNGMALVLAVSESDFERASEKGQAFSWSSGVIDINAGDTVLLIKNLSDTVLRISDVCINNGSVASQYVVHLPTTEVATPTGTALSAVVLNTSKVGDPDVTAISDETANVQGAVINTPMLEVDANLKIPLSGLMLGKNKSLAIDVVAETTESGVTIRGHY